MIKNLFCALSLLIFMSTNVWAVEFYTEDFPPYNYLKNNELVGIGPKIVRALAKEAGEDPKITVLPWVRAYKYAQEKQNTAIFSIVRTPKREPDFQWVGPLYTVRVGLYTTSNNEELYVGDNEANLEQARKVGDVAVQMGGAGEELLTTLKFKNLNPILDADKSFLLLLKGRYDILEASDVYMAYIMKEEQVLDTMVSEVAVIGQYDMYLAFSNSTPIETVEKWQQALERLMAKSETKSLD
ncbi:MAG: transporter substrate-binding domain-containing protein [Halopseudomonas aestusnigri]